MSVTAYSNMLEMLEMLMSTLSPACRMDTGNEGSGLELSHIRKFGCTFVSGCDILRIRILQVLINSKTKLSNVIGYQ